MNADQRTQILVVIRQLDKQKKYVPFITDLEHHELYGSFFQWLPESQKEEVNDMLRTYIVEEIQGFSTKGGEMFARFYELYPELFRTFRRLNADENAVNEPEFHNVGEQVEQALYTFEQILTKPMLKKPMWLAKVVEAFYDIASRFFPYYHRIGEL